MRPATRSPLTTIPTPSHALVGSTSRGLVTSRTTLGAGAFLGVALRAVAVLRAGVALVAPGAVSCPALPVMVSCATALDSASICASNVAMSGVSCVFMMFLSCRAFPDYVGHTSTPCQIPYKHREVALDKRSKTWLPAWQNTGVSQRLAATTFTACRATAAKPFTACRNGKTLHPACREKPEILGPCRMNIFFNSGFLVWCGRFVCMDLISLRRELREVEWQLFLMYRSGVWDDARELELWREVDRFDALIADWRG